MKCCNCGRENVEEANFCFYCGYSFRENVADAGNIIRKIDVTETVEEENEVQHINNGGLALKAWQWCLYFLLLVIPYAWPLWLVLTIMWCFSDNASVERRSFARGIMLFIGFMFVFSMVAAIYLVATYGTDGAINYLTNGAATSADAFMKMYGM